MSVRPSSRALSYFSPVVISFQAIRAILLANATAATTRPCLADGSHGLARIMDRSIAPSPLLLQLRFGRPTGLICQLRGGRRLYVGSGVEPRALVLLSRRHQFPGDTSHLVGKRHCGKLRWLALQESEEPARCTTFGLRLPDHRGRS